jgi:hypothetical protein
VVVSVANRATAEKTKKRKDDEKTKKAWRKKARLEWGKRHQGLEEEDEEEESGDEEVDDDEEEINGVQWDAP